MLGQQFKVEFVLLDVQFNKDPHTKDMLGKVCNLSWMLKIEKAKSNGSGSNIYFKKTMIST